MNAVVLGNNEEGIQSFEFEWGNVSAICSIGTEAENQDLVLIEPEKQRVSVLDGALWRWI